MNKEQLTLLLDGREWFAWKDISLTRQVDALSGTVSLSLADKWIHRMEPLPFEEDMPCQVFIGDVSIMNGYVMEDEENIAADHSISFTVFDKSIDLVDCAAIHAGMRLSNEANSETSASRGTSNALNTRMGAGQFQNLNLLELAQALARPFGVEVKADCDVGEVFRVFKLEPGETAFNALDRALKQRALLAMPDGKGGLALTRIGQNKCASRLELGKNFLSVQRKRSRRDRFSHYIVQGQQPGNDENFGLAAAAVKGEARDPNVKRYRPFIVRAENQVNPASALQRAQWEATVRAARAATISGSVQGWFQGDGSLWPLGWLVDLSAPGSHIEDQELVIAGLTFTQSGSGGSKSAMELKHKDAFAPEPLKPEKTAAAKAAEDEGEW